MCRCRRLSVTCTFILVHGARTDCSWRTVLAWRLYSEGKFQNTTWAIFDFQHVSDQCRTTAWSLDKAWRTLRGWSLLVSNCSYSLEQSNLVSVIVYNMTNMCLPGIRMCKWVLECFMDMFVSTPKQAIFTVLWNTKIIAPLLIFYIHFLSCSLVRCVTWDCAFSCSLYVRSTDWSHKSDVECDEFGGEGLDEIWSQEIWNAW